MQTKVTAELKTDAEGVDRECVLGGGERVGETTDLQTDLKCLLLQLPHLSTEISHIFPKKKKKKLRNMRKFSYEKQIRTRQRRLVKTPSGAAHMLRPPIDFVPPPPPSPPSEHAVCDGDYLTFTPCPP